MEASFCGCEKGEFGGLHFTTPQLMQMGRDLCRTLIYYFDVTNTIKEIEIPESKEESKNSNKATTVKIMKAPDKKKLY